MAEQFDPTRVCNSRSRQPGRYTKSELMNLGERYGFRFKKTDTIDKMCSELRRHYHQRNREETRNCMERCQTQLKPYQRRAIEYLNSHPSLFLFHKMGAGKTLTAIVASQCFLDQNPTRNVIVISPALLIENFKKEMNERYVNIQHRNRYKFYSIENPQISVSRLRQDLEHGMLIVDEVHRLVHDSQLSKVLQFRLHGIYDKVLLMSGTPLIAYTDFSTSVYPRLMNLDPEEMSSLNCKLSYYEREPRDLNYPQRRNFTVRVPMTPSYERRYNTFLRKTHFPSMVYVPSRQEMEDENILPIVFNRVERPNSIKKLKAFFTGIRRATQNLDNSEMNQKLNWLITFLRRHANEKTVVFSSYLRDGIDLIKQKLGNEFAFGQITGRKSIKSREEMIEQYNNGNLNLLFLSSNAREGISLKNTKNVIIFEPQWNTTTTEQMIARAIRYKSHDSLPVQDRVVNVYQLYHLKNNELPTLSREEVSNFFQNLPAEVAEHHIYPFLPIENKDIIEFEEYLKNLKSQKSSILNEFHTLPRERKQAFQKQLRKRGPFNLRLNMVSIDYYFYLHTILKTIKLDYFEHILKEMSIERNNC